MAKEDFCFTYYDGDAARDKAHMSRLERGAYDDLISAQRKFGHLSIEQIKKILSKDFDECWTSLEWILKINEAGRYYIEWVDKSIERSKAFQRKQVENGKKGGRPKKPDETQQEPNPNPNDSQSISQKKPLEDGDGDTLPLIDLEDSNTVVVLKNEAAKNLLIPQMFSVWSKTIPDYMASVKDDYAALGAIAAFICEQFKVSYQPQEDPVKTLVLTEWQKIAFWIKEDGFYQSFALKNINNNIQTIAQKQRGKKQTNGTNRKSSKSGDKSEGARLLLGSLLDDLNTGGTNPR